MPSGKILGHPKFGDSCVPGNSQIKPRILIVDDEPDITAALKLGLERAGFSVDVSNDAKTALG
jgi:PleD family two-component response regulator